MAAEVPKKNVAEIFRHHYSKLSEQITPEDITGKLYSSGLISQHEKEEIQVAGQPKNHMTSKMLDAVERAIKADDDKFYTFLKLLNVHRKYKRLIKKIMDDGELLSL